MNTIDVKENLGFVYYAKLILCALAVFSSFRKGNPLFQSIVTGLYLLSVLTVVYVLYRKIHNIIAAVLILLAAFVALIKLPLPGFVLSIVLLAMMFFGIVYDCFQWVRLAEITWDEKHGRREKWQELDRMERKTRHYSAEERFVGMMVHTAYENKKEGTALAEEMEKNIAKAEKTWARLQECYGNPEVCIQLMELREKYDQIISESASVRKELLSPGASMNPEVEKEKYERMRGYFNRFQRVRRGIDGIEKKYLAGSASGSGTQAVFDAYKYFGGCNSLESLQKRYKDLCRVYHPDMGNGSAEIFAEIQGAYEAMKKKYQG